MGIDNNGILFLGLESKDIDASKIPALDMELFDEDAVEALWAAGQFGKEGPRLTCQWQNDERDGKQLIGFELGNSGSYGCKEVVGLAEKIALLTTEFLSIFGKHPKIWIMNYQW